MKKNIGLFFGLMMAASIFFVTSSSNNEAFALSGCCKVRKPGGPWRKQGNDLPSCKKLNQKNDQDNVFKRSGNVWWDMSC